MKTDDLIRALAADAAPAPAPARRVLPLFLPAILVSVVAVLTVLGARPDLPQAMAATAFRPTPCPPDRRQGVAKDRSE